MMFCDDCENLNPKEGIGIHYHECMVNRKRLLHSGYHPSIPMPEWCPRELPLARLVRGEAEDKGGR